MRTRRFELVSGEVVSLFDMQLLAALRERPILDAGFLAALTHQSKNAVSIALRKLKQRGLVRIRYSPECMYDLTDDGYTLCEQFEVTH